MRLTVWMFLHNCDFCCVESENYPEDDAEQFTFGRNDKNVFLFKGHKSVKILPPIYYKKQELGELISAVTFHPHCLSNISVVWTKVKSLNAITLKKNNIEVENAKDMHNYS